MVKKDFGTLKKDINFLHVYGCIMLICDCTSASVTCPLL